MPSCSRSRSSWSASLTNRARRQYHALSSGGPSRLTSRNSGVPSKTCVALTRRLQCGVALFSRITEQQAYAEVVLVNEGFRRRQLPAPAYAFWEAHGVVVQAWVLASFMLNDEGPCYCGNLIAPDGQPWFFQVDFGDQDNCAWERVDEIGRASCRKRV